MNASIAGRRGPTPAARVAAKTVRCAVLVLVGPGLVIRKPRTVHQEAPSGSPGLVAGSGDHPEGEEDGHGRALVVRTGNPVVGRSLDD